MAKPAAGDGTPEAVAAIVAVVVAQAESGVVVEVYDCPARSSSALAAAAAEHWMAGTTVPSSSADVHPVEFFLSCRSHLSVVPMF